ncbi:unnamed protein product [Angiostrongylus costaricensis]|uniref:MSP domain-containing protein n=1 Tax=Angiostrongylus costaricensis TaxID=334426 RepID=A0A158PFK2_ANGCS|nr:unnamed protein product [Angiostrongylus costaricensis]
MIIAVFLSFQIILFLQLTTVCMKSVKDKQKNEKREEKENRSDKKHGEKEKKKTSEIKCEEMKASEKKNEEEKDEREKEETKKNEENKKEKKEQEKDEEKKTEEEKKEDQGKDKLKKEDETANDKKDLKEGLKLDVSPAELKWEFEQGQQAIKVKNNTMKRFAVKVKCTDTNIYTLCGLSASKVFQEPPKMYIYGERPVTVYRKLLLIIKKLDGTTL